MMVLPRFQCLNLARQVTKQSPNLRAGFSTSQKLRADDPPPQPSAHDLLDVMIDRPLPRASPSFTRFSQSQTPISLDENPIREPPKRQPNTESVQRLFAESSKRRDQLIREQRMRPNIDADTYKDITDHNFKAGLTKQIARRWKAGDVYAPHDLSGTEMMKWKKRHQPEHDVFDVLDFNPEQHYRNFSVMSEYMSPMGRIRGSKETGLRPVNQRRIARAIRRSIGLGLMPSVHRHPEILYKMIARHEGNTVAPPI